MREGWINKKLGEVISLEYGKPLPNDERCDEKGFPAYGANGIKCYALKPYWKRPSIIVGRKGTAGAVNLVDADFWPLDVTYYVRFDDGEYDLKFLYYLLSELDLPSLATGVKPGINRNVVYSIERYFPPPPEQKRIVAILDEAFAGIATAVANAEKNLANTRELLGSYLQGVFGKSGARWQERRLGELCEIKTGRKDVNQGNPRGKYPFFTCAREHTFCDEYSFDTEAILVAGNGDVGHSTYFKGKFEAYQRTYVLSEFEGVVAPYLFWVIKGSLKSVLSAQQLGNTMPYIKKGMLANFVVPLPSINEQSRLALICDELNESVGRLEAICQQKLDAVSELKQSLLQKAFSGELTAGEHGLDATLRDEEAA